MNFDAALEDAREKDKMVETMDPNELPPLHGLPIAIKDHMPIKGFVSTMGIAWRLDHIYKEDCQYVKTLREAGAIFYVTTTMP